MQVSRHKQRECAMMALYQHFLLGKDIKQCVYEQTQSNEIDPFLYTVTVDAVRYKADYIEAINQQLAKGWSFDRLGYIEQAILVMACCELDLKVAPKGIVIDEAITLAKRYCDEDTYRLINGVLDHL